MIDDRTAAASVALALAGVAGAMRRRHAVYRLAHVGIAA